MENLSPYQQFKLRLARRLARKAAVAMPTFVPNNDYIKKLSKLSKNNQGEHTMNTHSEIAVLGAISHDTMRPEDLIPCFRDTLVELDTAKEHAKLVEQVNNNLYELECQDNDNGYYESDDCNWDLEELFDALNEFAPPYCYFGAHEGNGSDYGFWVSVDMVNDDLRNNTIINVDSEEMPDHFVSINDHGNMTLYDRNMDVIWSIV